MLHNSNQTGQSRCDVRASRSMATILHTILWAGLAVTLVFLTIPVLYRNIRVGKGDSLGDGDKPGAGEDEPMITVLGLLAGYLTLFSAGFGITLLIFRGAPRIDILECCCLSWLFGAGAVSIALWICGIFLSG